MDWGMKNRMAKIIKPETGRCVMLAVDHGYFQGPTSRLEEPEKAIAPLEPYADSLMLTRGVLRNCVDANTRCPIVLRVSGGPSILKELSNEEITTNMKDALRLNAAGVGMSVFVGADYEKQTLVNLGHLVNEAQEVGMPVLAITAVGRDMVRDARYLGLACRIAAEIGANIVKTYYCDGFENVVKSCPVPVVIAGGKKIEEREALELTHNAVSRGAVGVDMGRNIWQSDFPVAAIRAVRAIVHENYSVKEAWELFEDVKNAVGNKNGGRKGRKVAQPA